MKKAWLLILIWLAATACSSAVTPPPSTDAPAAPLSVEVNLKNYGPAPELTNTVWLNTDQPLRLANLRGKVVLIDFWTFG